jgi:uncharacterized protein (DUF2384 family)
MSAAGLQFGSTNLTQNPVNPLELSARMGISLDTLARAARANTPAFLPDPNSTDWQSGLRTVADLWDDLNVLYGGQHNAKAFLAGRRPELMDETPIHYLKLGEPEVIQNLVHAITEMLP